LDPLSTLAGPVIIWVVSLIAHLIGSEKIDTALATAGVSVAVAAILPLLVQRTTKPIDQARARLNASLAVRARRLNGHLTEYCAAEELRPGEEVLVQAGEVVPADGTVVAGEARVTPWAGSTRSEARGEGDPIVAGATVTEGALRVVTGWTGSDRAWLRLVTDKRRRADLHCSLARAGRLIAQRGSLAAAALVLFSGAALGFDALSLVLAVAATHAAFAHAGLAELTAARFARACLEA